MGDFERTVREFKRTLIGGRQKTAPLDIMGKVTRVEDGVAWVRFAGSEVGDTPVRMTIDCKEGDDVQVRSSGGKAWIVGNQSAPPTDDTKASEAGAEARRAHESIQSVQETVTEVEHTVQEQKRQITIIDETAVTGVVVQYAKSTSPTVAPKSGWSSVSPTWESGKYIWQRTVTTIAGEQIVSNVSCIQGAKGERGQKGEDGTSVTILGHYDTEAELIAEHPAGSLGDAYLVGGDLYVWNGSAWENVGSIQGPQGEPGEKGDKGDKGDTGAQGEKGDKGDAGAKGSKGDKGDKGDRGERGVQGNKGDTGTGVSALEAEYYLSTSEDNPIGGSWQTTPPAYIEGRHYWTRTKITWSTGSVSYTTEVLDQGITNANSAALQALRKAGNAEDIAEATGQHFWADDDGLHVSSEPDLPAATRNTIWNALGMLFRKGLNPILGILTGDSPRVAIYDGQGSGEEHEVASFGKEIIMNRGGKRFFTLRKKSFSSDPELILGDEEDRCTVVDKTGVTIKDNTTDSSFNYNAKGMFNRIGFYQETGVDGRNWEFSDLQIWSYESYATNGMTIWSKDQYRRFSFPRKKIVAIKNTSDVEMIVVTKGVLVAAQWVLGVNVVQLSLQFRTSGSIPAGQNAFEAELSDGAVSYLPLAGAYGVGYYGSTAMVMGVTTGGKITIRNTGSTAVSVQSPNSCFCVATYITDGDFGSEFE